jgi:carboxypeptidase family protein/BACON domain-containing protein
MRPARRVAFLVTLALLGATAKGAETEPLRVRRNFLGMHNLKGGGVTPFQTGLDWTRTLVHDGFVLDWVTDFAPNAPDHWIFEAMRRGLVPVVRVQQCQPSGEPNCAPSAGYSVGVAAQILDWKVAHPEYANRYVYLQLWNEPGDARDFVPMDQYADFLVAAYAGIRNVENQYAAAHPELDLKGTLMVMTPGQNDGWLTAFDHNPLAKFSFDVWATHPYPDLTPPWWNIHDGDLPPNYLKTIDSYIQDIDECARTHHGVPGRRGFPVMITETNYGWFVGTSPEGWPKLTQEARAPYTVDAFFDRWYQWPEILAVHPFLLSNVKWPGFEFVHSWASEDVEAPFGVLEPANPYPVYTALKQAREETEARGALAAARLSPYRGPVGQIRGKVTRADTGEAVPYATLFTDGHEFGHLTLFDGFYEIHDVPVGTYTLGVQKATYLAASRLVTVAAGSTTVADFDLTFTGRRVEKLYAVRNTDGSCDETCANLFAVDHWQAFVTGPETGFIKYASCQINKDEVTMRLSIHEGGPGGPQVGAATLAHNPAGAGDSMIGWEWPDGQEPVVQPSTTYWLHFQREDGQAIYGYASNANPYPAGNSSSSNEVDFYGYVFGLTREVNPATGTIMGTVTDTAGNPLAGASVTRAPGGVSATTAGDGSYTMDAVPLGTYSLTATRSGYGARTVGGQAVAENGVTRVDFALAAAPPVIALSTPSLATTVIQGADATAASFTVRNAGGGALAYSIGVSASWLSVTPASGSSTGEADTIAVTRRTSGLAPGTYRAAINVSDPSATNSPQTIDVTLAVTAPVEPGTVVEDFESAIPWSSSFDASWGGAAVWTVVGGGQAGNALQASRTVGGSSVKVKVYDILANTDYTLSLYIRCPSLSGGYWAESAYRLGNFPASDFDGNAGAWSLVQKFSNSGTNGNGNVWRAYTATFNSGASTRISVGFKLGASGAFPGVQWDTLRLVPAAAPPPPPPPPSIGEGFESLPAWSSSFDAAWGGAASWSIVGGGASGSALQAARSTGGSSSKVKVYDVRPDTSYTLSVSMRGPGSASSYWAECAYRVGASTAQEFDGSPGAWTLVSKFSNTGTNGNGNAWARYSVTFASGAATQVSVGVKLGSTGPAPSVAWDSLRIE